MILTDEEKAMRDGAEGRAVAAAMDLLIRYGEALDAERLCDTRNVAGTTTQPSPAKARLVAEGGWNKAFAVINLDCDEPLEIPDMKVPTCQLQHGFGPDSVGTVPYPKEFVELQTDAESFYGRSAARCTRRSTTRARPRTSTSCCSAARTPRSTRSGRRPGRSTGSGCTPGRSCGSWLPARSRTWPTAAVTPP
ncbi:hypothetical protein GCM10009608_18830 [Pseudonocardia alaniniphila]